ncbi:MAG: GTPase HflX [Antricoccus sp.]
MRREIGAMKTGRDTKRSARRRNDVPAVVIAGYTNAGKSTLLNRITGAGVLVENALFATLDPTVRRATTSDGREYTLSDTVGFVRQLPHQLVEAFRSSLEEVESADVLIHVVDGSHPDPEGQISAVREVLSQIGALNVPELMVINKTDAADRDQLDRLERALPGCVSVSARSGAGIDALLAAIETALPRPQVEFDVLIPYHHGEIVARLHDEADIMSTIYLPDGTAMTGRAFPSVAASLRRFAR